MRVVEKSIDEINLQNILNEKITKHLSDINLSLNYNKQKILELCQIGKLVGTYFPNYDILELIEKPDVVISNGVSKVGIEHQLVVDFEEKEREGFYRNIFDKVEIILKKKNNLPNFLINVFLKNNLSYKIKDKNKIITEITKIIEHYIKTKELFENAYIYDVLSMKHNSISVCPNFGGYVQKWIDEDTLKQFIEKKEKKISLYRSNFSYPIWLVLVIGGLGKSSYELNNTFEIEVKSSFDKIFLFEDFNNTLYELK